MIGRDGDCIGTEVSRDGEKTGDVVGTTDGVGDGRKGGGNHVVGDVEGGRRGQVALLLVMTGIGDCCYRKGGNQSISCCGATNC